MVFEHGNASKITGDFLQHLLFNYKIFIIQCKGFYNYKFFFLNFKHVLKCRRNITDIKIIYIFFLLILVDSTINF